MLVEKRDIAGLANIEYWIRKMPKDCKAHIRCFNKDEADWIRAELENHGIDKSSFTCSWLVFKE